MILGIDVGTSMGWALTQVAEDETVDLIAHGALKIPTKNGPLVNLERVGSLFRSFATHGEVAGVYVEDVPFSKFPMASASYWRVRTLAEIVGAERGWYPFTTVNVSTLKRWATGKGNARKPAMCKAVRDRFGVPLYADKGDVAKGSKAQEDQADAILVATWAHS